VTHYGRQDYNRAKARFDSEGRKWPEQHERRDEGLVYPFYALSAMALISLGAEWKRSKAVLPLTLLTLVLAVGTWPRAIMSRTLVGISATRISLRAVP
jgi:hypothetical protein